MSANATQPIEPIPVIEFIGTAANDALWGITCMQTFLYYVYNRHGDHIMLKLLVAWLWFMDTAHQILVNRGFWVLVSRVHNPFILSKEYLVAGVFTALVALPTQLFFTYRIWRFSGEKWWFAAFFITLSLFQLAGYMAFTALCFATGIPTAQIIFDIQNLPIATWAVGAGQDILIALILIFLLWRRKISEGFRSTDQLVHRLAILTINTGIWPALCALFTIITLVVYPNVQIYVSLYFILCPIYCNTILANLNARAFIRGDNFHNPSTGTSGDATSTIVLGQVNQSAASKSGGQSSQATATESYKITKSMVSNPMSFATRSQSKADPDYKDEA